MIEKLYELQATNHYEKIKIYYDTENEQVYSIRESGEKVYYKTDDAISVINHYDVKSVNVTHYFILLCYDELERRYDNKELTKNELFLWNVIQDRDLGIQNLKRDLRKEYKILIKTYKRFIRYDDLINDVYSAEQLALIKLFHEFCLRDLFGSYELIKKVYDIAFLQHCNIIYYDGIYSDGEPFYEFLIDKFYEYDKSYNPFDWGRIIAFFERIIKDEGNVNE